MMISVTYLFTATLLLAAMLLVYWLVFQHDKLLHFNRYYLLATLVLPWVAPLLPNPITSTPLPAEIFTVTLPPITLTGSDMGGAPPSATQMLRLIWIGGMAVSSVLLGWRVFHLYQRIRNSAVYSIGGLRLIATDGPIFSFGKAIFAPPALLEDLHHPVMRHEIAHVRQWHTLDILLGELVTIVLWFHPLVHGAKKAIKANHEYLADAAALQAQDINQKTYSEIMIQHATRPVAHSLGNYFSTSQIKKRMIMVHKQLSLRNAWWKRMLLLPVLGLIMLWACDPAKNTTPVADGAVIEDGKPAKAQPIQMQYDSIYQVVEKMPEFKGGMDALIKYFSDNLQYPQDYKGKDISVSVFTSFVISKEGKVTNAEIIKNDGPEAFSAEALRVLAAMPDWHPGRQDGETVPVKYVLPIRFEPN